MALEAKEIPSLIFWFLVVGIGFYVAAKATEKVSERVSEIIQ